MPDQIENANVAPNLDAELDAALNKSFANIRGEPEQLPVVQKDTAPNETGKPEVKKDEVKQEIKEEVKNETNKVSAPEDKSLPDPDSISDTVGAKASNVAKEGWNALKNNYKKAHRIAQEKDGEIAKLKATLAEKGNATQKELETLKSQMSELEKYRAMVDIQADPEFISKFDKPVSDAIDGIKGLIKGMNVSQETVDAIDFNDPQRLQQIVDIIAQNKDRFTAAKIERKMREYLDLADKRNETVQEQKNNYKDTLEKRKQELFAKSAEGEGRMMKHLQSKATEKGQDGKPLIPFLNKMEPKENATQSEIDQVNNHNGLVDIMGKKLEEVMKMKEPEQQAEIAIAAVASHYLMSEVRALRSQLQKAQEELKKVSVVQTETPTRKPNNPTGKNGQNGEVDHDTALNKFFSNRR